MELKKLKLDQSDYKILELIQSNAKITAQELSKHLALSPTPIYERIKKMEKMGVIRGYKTDVDMETLGFDITVFVNISILSHKLKERTALLEALMALPEVIALYHTSGKFDLMAKVNLRNTKEYRTFLVHKLANLPNIGDIDSQIVLEELKNNYNLSIEEVL